MKENFINVTGTDYLVYVLWGESPDSPDYTTYGFETKGEQDAFIFGVDEGDGWMEYMAVKGHSTNKDARELFEQEIRQVHPHLFEEKSE